METCTCGHGQHVHVGYTGGCGLCECAAVRYRRVTFETTTTTTTEAPGDR